MTRIGMQVDTLFNKKANVRNRANKVPHLTLDTIWKKAKNTRKHHTQESQEVSHFPAGVHKAARNRQVFGQYNKDKHETQITKKTKNNS